MQIIKTIPSLKKKILEYKKLKKTIGFVPTMGDLHDGHLSLIRKSRRENDITVLSVFINPKQFGPNEDYTKYPREEKKDKLLAKKEKVDIMFFPTDKILYPEGYLTYVETNEISGILCGKSRPGHFKGVTTIVAKLLNLVEPDRLYLGQKDAQQAVILKQMIRDLNFPVSVKICPIVRDSDGLALSSRNRYLTASQRREAVILYDSLKKAVIKIRAGQKSPSVIKSYMQNLIKKNSTGKIDYIECVDADTLKNLQILQGKIMIALAVRFSKTRLIDNIIFTTR